MFSIDNKVVQVLRDCRDQEDDGGAAGLGSPSSRPCERTGSNPVDGKSKSAVATRRSFLYSLSWVASRSLARTGEKLLRNIFAAIFSQLSEI